MKNTVVKILNILLSIASITTFFLLIVTAGVWIKAMDETLLASAVSAGTHQINIFGALYAAIMAFFVSVLVAMILIKKKNTAETFSVVINFLFIGFLAIYFTANVSGFVFVFAGLSLAFSILVAMLMIPKEKK